MASLLDVPGSYPSLLGARYVPPVFGNRTVDGGLIFSRNAASFGWIRGRKGLPFTRDRGGESCSCHGQRQIAARAARGRSGARIAPDPDPLPLLDLELRGRRI